jgi:hypothetical protein
MSARTKQFLLAFKGSHDKWNRMAESEWAELNRQHGIWKEKFKGGYRSAAKLASAPSRVLAGDKDSPRVTDGPFTETKEVLTGFYVIDAESLDHATELARGCPWLLHDSLEIFEIES